MLAPTKFAPSYDNADACCATPYGLDDRDPLVLAEVAHPVLTVTSRPDEEIPDSIRPLSWMPTVAKRCRPKVNASAALT